MVSELLGPAEIRALAAELGIRPTKTLGQNFVHDPNTVRRIVRAAEVTYELRDGEKVAAHWTSLIGSWSGLAADAGATSALGLTSGLAA